MKLLVMVEGCHFQMDAEDGVRAVGFLANRVVEADNASSIDTTTLFARVREELLASRVLETTASKMWISLVSAPRDLGTREYNGFSFYYQDNFLRRAIAQLRSWFAGDERH